MSTTVLAAYIFIAFAGGIIAALIAAGRGLSVPAYFFFGLLLPLFGIIAAAVAKPPRPVAPGGTPAGWYPDPSGVRRWWDGSTWTNNTR